MYYLQMNGTTSKIQVPSITFDKVVLDIVSRKVSGKTEYLIDARTGTTGYLYSDTNLNEIFAAFRLYVNDVQYSTGANAIPAGTRATIRLENPVTGTDDVTLFARYTGIQFLQADVYDIKFYNGATLQAHYDLTLGDQLANGTIKDETGNGYTATLTDGTWVSDGGGSTPITVNAVIAGMTADSPVPSISAQQQISISSVLANAGIDAIVPTVESIRNISIEAPISNLIAQALVPSVGSIVSTQISAFAASLAADVFAPSIAITQGTRIDSVIAELKADVLPPTLQTDMIIQAFIADLEAMAIGPALNAKVIVGVIELNGKRELYVYLVGKQELNVNLKGVLN